MRHAAVLALVGSGIGAWPACAQDCLWRLAPPVAPPAGGAAAFDAGSGRTLYVEPGPVGGSVRLWAWDGASWTLQSTTGPARRSEFATAHDSARGRLVLFGGYVTFNGLYPTDTWEWDGASWTQVATAGPPPRRGHAMAYDSLRGRVVLFGGGPQNGVQGDTWEWDGVAWAQRSMTGPPPRRDHAMAFDSTRGRAVLFGGVNTGLLGDLWEWDGAAWAQRPVSGPGPRSGAAMVHDPARGRLVLIGSESNPVPPSLRGETWELDPAAGSWTLRSASTPGDPGVAAFDVLRGRAVLVTGAEVWEYNGSASSVAPWVSQQPVGGLFAPGSRVELTVVAAGTGPLSYRWQKNGSPVVDGGPISGATTDRLVIDPAAFIHSGSYRAVVTNACGEGMSAATIVSVLAPCYANCDSSTIPPVLNVMDFICFQSRYAAGDSAANCDGSTAAPILNVNDFICFQNAFARGCQ